MAKRSAAKVDESPRKQPEEPSLDSSLLSSTFAALRFAMPGFRLHPFRFFLSKSVQCEPAFIVFIGTLPIPFYFVFRFIFCNSPFLFEFSYVVLFCRFTLRFRNYCNSVPAFILGNSNNYPWFVLIQFKFFTSCVFTS